MAELKLEHIKKTYDNNNTVVKDFNLHLLDKEFIVFVGPSGCGKSTNITNGCWTRVYHIWRFLY